MEKYLSAVAEQIRCKIARPYVEKELRDHIEDQVEYNISKGMEHEEAVKAAVREMGDPVETGISLDRIHRPKPAWGVIALMAVITIAAMSLQLSLASTPYILRGVLIQYLFGFVIMLICYFVDYTVVARYAKHIAVLLMFMCVYCRLFGLSINGIVGWIRVFGVMISIKSIMLLYIPVFAGVLYKYRNTGIGGIIKSVIWMVIPSLYIIRYVPALSFGVIMAVSMLSLITFAIIKGWFTVPKRTTIVALWGVIVGIPIVVAAIRLWSGITPAYIQARLLYWLFPGQYIGYNNTTILREAIRSTRAIGSSEMNLVEKLSGYNSDYIFAYISSTYGLLVGILVLSLLVFLVVSILGISLKQKNQLGMMMGVGVGTVLMINTVLNILVAIGLFPDTSTFLPLFSSGSSNILITYALIGIILSIYKYKSIYPKFVDVSLPNKALF
ncbi:MAG: FtsW/RodA/SpoVE family cell cycle protein [Butyrivibrio sp.]|nr:FtsW/RodA/SpoVE family cell cycle protein [Butyrivibrio sp.]